MDDVREEIRSFLAEKPALESDFEALLEVDDEGPWTFDEVPLDSGTFGEVVSRGIVEEHDDGYRLTDSEAVRAALDGEPVETESDETTSAFSLSLPDVDRQAGLALAGALAFVAIVRVVFMWGSVFRGEDVVLAGNDPWGYRYFVEQLLAADISPFAFESLPEFIGTGLGQDHLYVVVAWWIAELLGGTPRAAGLALAWLPVVSAVLTALLVYLIAVRLSADRRIGLASVALLALTPAHAYRTALGFGDHHAFDYLWLTLTAYALVVLATEYEGVDLKHSGDGGSLRGSRAIQAATVLLGLGITAQSLAWRAGPLLYLPVGGYAAYRAVSDVRVGSSPLYGNLPLIVGIAIAALLAVLPSTVWGWSVTWVRSFAPALLLCGVLGVLLLSELGSRFDLPAKAIGGGTIAVGVASFAVSWVALPGFTSTVTDFSNYMARTGQSNIAETASLFSGDLGSVVGPILILGFVLYLAVPSIGLALWKTYRSHRPAWAIVVIYVVYFLLLATIQLRFAGQLAVFVAIFAGIGFVHLAAVVDLTTRPRVLKDWHSDTQRSATDGCRLSTIEIPDRSSLGYLFALFLLVTSISLVQVPVKQEQIAIDDETYETATWIGSNASIFDPSNSDGYVFSSWGRNRVYNHFLDGDSESYWYARQNYADFLRTTNEAEWYDQLSNRNTSVVTVPRNVSDPNSLQVRLHENLGSETEQSESLSHYRLQHVSDGGERKVFSLVPGAGITGRAPPNETIHLQTNQTVAGTSFTYERTVRTTMNGWYTAIVPYPGQYSGVNETYVPETAVTKGRFMTNRRSEANWPLEAGRGSVALDVDGGNHARIHGASWIRTNEGHALSFDGNDTVVVPNASALQSDEFTLSVRFRTREGVDYVNETRFPRLVSTAPSSSFRDTSGFMIGLASGNVISVVGDGEQATKISSSSRVDDGEWHTATLVRNGSAISFYLDDELIGERQFAGEIHNWNQLGIGGSADQNALYRGYIDTVKFETN